MFSGLCGGHPDDDSNGLNVDDDSEKNSSDGISPDGRVKAVGNEEIFVISIDLGTTGSAVAFSYRDGSGKIIYEDRLLTSWPGLKPGTGKTPSELVYDGQGNVLAWGGDCSGRAYSETELDRNGWIKAKYFKILINTSDYHQGSLTNLSRLPPSVSPFRAWGDYLKRLHENALVQIINAKGSSTLQRCREHNRLLYVITCPVRWRRDGLTIISQLREQAVRAGLVSKASSDALDFVDESEAAAIFCYKKLQADLRDDGVFAVVHAGCDICHNDISTSSHVLTGHTVDMTLYRTISTKPYLALKLLRAPVGISRGSVYIDHRFQTQLEYVLEQQYPGRWSFMHVQRGVKEFQEKIKPIFSMDHRHNMFITVGSWSEFNDGDVELRWHDVEIAFEECIPSITSEVQALVTALPGLHCQSILCYGGLGGSAYLGQYLSRQLNSCGPPYTEVVQPDGVNNEGSVAVVRGALWYALDRPVKTRISG